MIRAVVVAVPARDEERRLPAALASIAVAAAACPVPVVVVVAADACTDRTAQVAVDGGALVVPSSAGRVGAARDLAVRTGLAAVGEPPAAVWIAGTDADCAVPEGWLLAHVAAAAAGAALLRGSVRPGDELAAPLARLWQQRNPPLDPHPYVHGANLGVRGDAYLAAGGFPHLAHDEDVALVRSVAALGLPVRSTDRAPVVTSGRLSGRAPAGFAHYLRSLAEVGPG